VPTQTWNKTPEWATTAIANPTPTTTLIQMNLVYTFPTYFFRIPFILPSHLLRVVNRLFHSGFPTKTLYTCVFSPTHATSPTPLTLLNRLTPEHTIIKHISEVLSTTRKNDKNCTLYCNMKFIYLHVMWQLYKFHFINCSYSAYYFLGDSAPSVISWFNPLSY